MADTEDPNIVDDAAAEITDRFSETARALFSAGSEADTLQRVVDLAVETIEGCDYAGIFLLEGDAVTTPVHTDPLVIEVDALQHRFGEGPCLDAITKGGPTPRSPRRSPTACTTSCTTSGPTRVGST